MDVADVFASTATCLLAQDLRDLFRAAWTLKEQLPSRYAATGQPIEEAFWRTLIANREIE